MKRGGFPRHRQPCPNQTPKEEFEARASYRMGGLAELAREREAAADCGRADRDSRDPLCDEDARATAAAAGRDV